MRGIANGRAGKEARITAGHSGGDSKLDRRRVDRSRQARNDARRRVGLWMATIVIVSIVVR